MKSPFPGHGVTAGASTPQRVEAYGNAYGATPGSHSRCHLATHNRPSPGFARCVGTLVGTVSEIGIWSGGSIDGTPCTGSIYGAECVSCHAVLTGSAPSGTSMNELEWRMER